MERKRSVIPLLVVPKHFSFCSSRLELTIRGQIQSYLVVSRGTTNPERCLSDNCFAESRSGRSTWLTYALHLQNVRPADNLRQAIYHRNKRALCVPNAPAPIGSGYLFFSCSPRIPNRHTRAGGRGHFACAAFAPITDSEARTQIRSKQDRSQTPSRIWTARYQ